MKRFLLFGLLLIVSLQISCARDNESGAAGETRTTMTDDDLEDLIEVRLDADPTLKDADISIDADAEHNTVKLSGEVENEAQRTRAMEIARSAHPGVTVDAVEMEVEPRELARTDYTEEHARRERDRAKEHNETIGSSVDDAWIHAKVVTKLIGDTQTSERHINVDVNNNVVTLRGTVDTAEEKTEAERLAKETEGVTRVNNQLKVGKS
jgi:osmotically-inducible protein OsmY